MKITKNERLILERHGAVSFGKVIAGWAPVTFNHLVNKGVLEKRDKTSWLYLSEAGLRALEASA